ncbi:hypothetical protein IH575_05050 [Candidatus Dojkabacteria bacterium]|jgi:hypothetical protein|nr:hypothetical protein [Candidatus Dojkabacteria bacterium]
MKRLLSTLFVVIAAFSSLSPIVVKADAGAQTCVPGTGINGIPCTPCYPGPYNICAPSTGIIFNDSEINEGAVFLSAAAVLVGAAFIINGKNLKKKAE